MADVTVVAIFMAYIGFNGILDDQMESLNGYLVIVAFVLYGLALSQILKKITRRASTAHQ